MSTPSYPVRLVGGEDLGRSRLTVFFRIFLLIPHLIVLVLYSIAAYVVVVIAWFAAVITGRVPEGMHNFIAGFIRYSVRVTAYGTILAIPCWFVSSVLQYLLELLAIGNWIVALILGSVPNGMQTLGLFCLRFSARTNAYVLLVNPRYPAFGDTPASLPADQTALPPLP